MDKNYKGYTANQLLNDESFIQSQLHPNIQTEEFWEKQKENDLQLKSEIELACSFVRSFRGMFSSNLLSPYEEGKLLEQINLKNKRLKRQRRIRLYSFSAAAVILFFLLITPFFVTDKSEINYQEMISSVNEDMKNKQVQLILSKEDTIVIPEIKSNISYDKKGQVNVNSKQIDRKIKETPIVKEENKQEEVHEHMNQLIVPYGKRSFLTLSDGSKVWVNSGSRVIYPSTFKTDKREIYVEGEVYLDVTHDENRPFYVKTKQVNVRVLGTTFNVCAYPEDLNQQVVLVSGKVDVSVEKKHCIIKPSERFEYDSKSKESSVNKVNTIDYTAWVNGYYQFRQQNLSSILTRLSRYYGVNIEFDKDVQFLKCSGKLDLKEDLDDVLKNLKKAVPIKIVKENDDIFIMYN